MNQSTLEDSNYVTFFCKREHGTSSWWLIPPDTWLLSKLGEVSLVVVGMAESSIKGWPFSGVHMRFRSFKNRWTPWRAVFHVTANSTWRIMLQGWRNEQGLWFRVGRAVHDVGVMLLWGIGTQGGHHAPPNKHKGSILFHLAHSHTLNYGLLWDLVHTWPRKK